MARCALGHGQIASKLLPARQERTVHNESLTGESGTRFAMPAMGTRHGQRVAPVASLDESVGTKAQARFAGHDLVDNRRIGPCVYVVDELRALVAKKLCVLKPNGPFHRRQS